jgi:D-3-phosphoglycerate dehydrogenase
VFNILVTEPEYFDKTAIAKLKKLGNVTAKRMTREELESTIKEIDILVIRIETTVDASLLGKAKRLRIIGSATTGLDHIDLKKAASLGIEIINLHGVHTKSTAEHTMALMLSLSRNIPWAFEHMKEGGWDRYKFIGHQLGGKTLGIIGLGRIGAEVAKYAEALGMNIIYSDPYVSIDKFKKVNLSDLLKEADIITLHAMHTKETDKMISAKEFGMMKKSALFINTSRAEIIDETALLSALKEGRIGGAAIDVFPKEPFTAKRDMLIDYAIKHQNLLLTPHLGASTFEALSIAGNEIADKVTASAKKLIEK